MAKKHRKKNKRARAASVVGFIAVLIIAVVLYSQEVKLRAIYAEQAQLEEVIAGQQEEMDRLEYMIEYTGSESYLIQYAREKLGYVRPDEIKFDIE
ncbi:MAG: septum formation initiator family protein [Clostridia bacterium]|nr:septum formation initiator family protein [Clostridia bacterium]